MHSSSILTILAVLPALALAAPAPTPTTASTKEATTTTPAADQPTCLYSVVGAPAASATAYAAYMPNRALSVPEIQRLFEEGSSGHCRAGSHFTARELGSTPYSDDLVPGHYFGGIEYSSSQDDLCTPADFASIVNAAVAYGQREEGSSGSGSGSGVNDTTCTAGSGDCPKSSSPQHAGVVCRQYSENEPWINASFDSAAKAYFAGLK